MAIQAGWTIFIVAVLNSVLPTTISAFSISSNLNGVNINGISMGYDEVNSGYFSVNSYQTYKDGKCVQNIKVTGKGIRDTFDTDCSNKGLDIYTTNDAMIVGDPKTYALFSDKPATVVIIKDGKCTRNEYKDGAKSKTSSPVEDSECAALKKTIVEEQEKNRKYWEDWKIKFDQEMTAAFPPGFPFHKQKPKPVSGSPSSGYAPTPTPSPYVPSQSLWGYSPSMPSFNSWQDSFSKQMSKFTEQMGKFNQQMSQFKQKINPFKQNTDQLNQETNKLNQETNKDSSQD